MDILVVGASGFIGSAVFSELSKHHNVYGTYNKRKDKFENSGKMFCFDIADIYSFKNILEHIKPQVVVSSVGGGFETQMAFHEEAAKYIAGRDSGRLIYLSSGNVFDGDLSRPHYEDDPPSAASGYGKFKASCEKMLHDILGKKCVIIRPPFVLGRNCPRTLKLREDTENGKGIDAPEDLYANYALDVQVASYIGYIIDNNLTGIFHTGSYNMCDYMEFVRNAAEGLKFKTPVFKKLAIGHAGRKYQAVLTVRDNIPQSLTLSVSDVLKYIIG